MNLPCRECINPKACKYRCRVTGKNDPVCFECIVCEELEIKETSIIRLHDEVSKYKDKANKFDELMEAFTSDMIKIVAKALAKSL